MATTTPEEQAIQDKITLLQGQVAAAGQAGITDPNQQIPASVLSSVPTAPTSTSQPGAGIDDQSYLGVLNNLNTGLQQNNTLVSQKNLIQKQLFDQPLSASELAQLPPDVRAIVQGGNQDQMKLQLQVINDSLQGRNQSVAQSIQFLTTGWENAQAQKNTEETNLLNYSKAYGVKPLDIVKAIYPDLLQSMSPDQLQALTNLGAPLMTTTQVPSSTGGFPAGSQVAGSAASVNNATGIGYDAASGTYQQFSNPEDSIIATSNLLQSYQDGSNSLGVSGDTTLDQATNMYINGTLTPQAGQGYTGADVASALGVSASTPIKQLDPTQWADAIASFETGYNATPSVSPNPPDPSTANKVDSTTGMTPNGIYQASLEYAFTKSMPSLGLGSATQTRAARFAIVNKAAAIVSASGQTFPQLQALYKANSAAATQTVERLAKVESVAQAMSLNFPRLESLADQVAASGTQITESDLTATTASIERKFGNTAAAGYIELLQTMRSDYSAMQAGLAGSRGGQFFAAQASDAIPIGLTSAQYQNIYQQIQLSSQNATQAINGEVQNLLGTSGTSASSAAGGTNAYSGTGASTSSGATDIGSIKSKYGVSY